ncbi:PASTA domain-containing protein [Gordonia sp. CPCC 205515]|uniref:PASTA domain-containing protein n=1 Tax=Gordonia sp. CPCC 205515 TaxID=3140791 RepID=UPI003AF3D189
MTMRARSPGAGLSIAAAVLLVGGCGGATDTPATVTVTAPATSTVDMATEPSPAATETTEEATATDTAMSTEPAATTTTTTETQAIMPNVVCMNLQLAQDAIQAAGVFFSRSRDATGQGRHQILDRDWVVVGQTPDPGTPFTEGDAVLSVVKNSEPNPC